MIVDDKHGSNFFLKNYILKYSTHNTTSIFENVNKILYI